MRIYSLIKCLPGSFSIPKHEDRNGCQGTSCSYRELIFQDSNLLVSGNKGISKSCKGFSLLELLITLVIITILAAMVTFSTSFVRQERLKSTAKDLVADLQGARAEAMRQGSPTNAIHGIGIRFTLTSYVTFTFNDTSIANYQYDNTAEELNGVTQDLSTSQVQMLVGAALFPPALPDNVIIFDNFGFPRQPDWQRIIDKTVVLSDPSLAGYSRCIRIQTTRIREGIWNGAACNDQ